MKYNDTLLFDESHKEGREEPIQSCEYLHRQRMALGMTQQEVANAAGIHIRQYQRFEGGEKSLASAGLRIGLSICDVLKLDPHRFVPPVTERQNAE